MGAGVEEDVLCPFVKQGEPVLCLSRPKDENGSLFF